LMLISGMSLPSSLYLLLVIFFVFVDNKGNKKWVWLALDVDTRETVGVYIGDRDEVAARKVELIKGVNNLPLCFLFAPIELIVSLSKLLTLP